MLITLSLIIFGILCLYFGAEYLVHGSSSFALRMGLPPLVVGLTIVGYGTGIPELIVSTEASWIGKGDIAVGNVIGSNLANIGLVLGASALCRPIRIHYRIISYDGVILALLSFGISVLFYFEKISRIESFLLLLGLLFYTIWTLRLSSQEDQEPLSAVEDEVGKMNRSLTIDWLMIVGGGILLIVGGHYFLEGSVNLARYFEVSDAVIGLTIVAIGTSLPELATSFIAMLRNHGDIAVGNVVGSCIFNILAIIGTASLIAPIHLKTIQFLDYGLMTLFAVLLLAMMLYRPLLSRWQGGFFLAAYLSYLFYLI